MLVINNFNQLIDSIQVETEQRLQKLKLPLEPACLYDPIRFVLKGKGKRLRPVLVHLSGRGFSADSEDLMKAGMAVELMHNFTLVHDDIMDDDDTRHGYPTVHKQFGVNEAILSGDSIFTLGQLMVGQITTNPIDAFKAFNQASLSICEGQALDLEFEHDPNVTLEQYLEMIGKKTGKLLSLCAELGAILGNQPEMIRKEMRNYGGYLGKAFQVQDDILEIFSDAQQMGKSLGSDVAAGKQTILTLLARQAKGWSKIEHSKDKLPDLLQKMRAFFLETGVKDQADKLSNDFIQKAKSSLTILKEGHRNTLIRFTELVLNRTH